MRLKRGDFSLPLSGGIRVHDARDDRTNLRNIVTIFLSCDYSSNRKKKKKERCDTHYKTRRVAHAIAKDIPLGEREWDALRVNRRRVDSRAINLKISVALSTCSRRAVKKSRGTLVHAPRIFE